VREPGHDCEQTVTENISGSATMENTLEMLNTSKGSTKILALIGQQKGNLFFHNTRKTYECYVYLGYSEKHNYPMAPILLFVQNTQLGILHSPDVIHIIINVIFKKSKCQTYIGNIDFSYFFNNYQLHHIVLVGCT
jgi:hypothetical protein